MVLAIVVCDAGIKRKEESLNRTLDLLTRELEANTSATKPVFVIDDVQSLIGSASSDEERRVAERLLGWLVHVSKDRKLCQVFFASSDAFISETLEKCMNIIQITIILIVT